MSNKSDKKTKTQLSADPMETTLPSYDEKVRAEQNITQADLAEGETIVIPLATEEATITKREVESGLVRIHKKVKQEEKQVNEPRYRHEVRVERVAVNREVDTMPDVRYEGQTMIIPVVEEEVIIRRRLVLKEELRVTTERIDEWTSETVTLRHEEVEVQRIKK